MQLQGTEKQQRLYQRSSAPLTFKNKGGAAWTAALQWPGQSGFNAASRTPWNIRLTNGTSYNAGTSQVYQNFAWLEVNNAGHM
jgi:carboxypeptidase C (cathepsin A)